MSYLIDANIIIAYLRDDKEGGALFEKILSTEEPLLISVLTRFEVLRLVRPSEETKTGQALHLLEHLDIHAAIVDQAIPYAKKFQKANRAIDPIDYLIAATAKVHELPLLTYNLKHFPMMDIKVLGRDFEI